eukprot:TRINITY_DN881_c0_g1_i1.p1 TRINITY_DN881_c0_g1~~TRINITY_DN881_c0_g1_i1.p1  ORF type:complete len:394 (+),score=137.10 TRINITY_DN881_c0_g1_i1:172-1353(+)
MPKPQGRKAVKKEEDLINESDLEDSSDEESNDRTSSVNVSSSGNRFADVSSDDESSEDEAELESDEESEDESDVYGAMVASAFSAKDNGESTPLQFAKATHPLDRSVLDDADVELWLFKTPASLNPSKLITLSKLDVPVSLSSSTSSSNNLVDTPLFKVDGKKYHLTTIQAHASDSPVLNVLPSRKKNRLLLGKPFARHFTVVEDITVPPDAAHLPSDNRAKAVNSVALFPSHAQHQKQDSSTFRVRFTPAGCAFTPPVVVKKRVMTRVDKETKKRLKIDQPVPRPPAPVKQEPRGWGASKSTDVVQFNDEDDHDDYADENKNDAMIVVKDEGTAGEEEEVVVVKEKRAKKTTTPKKKSTSSGDESKRKKERRKAKEEKREKSRIKNEPAGTA